MTASRVQVLGSLVVVVLGLALMVAKIAADSEPGAIPLLLVVLGVGWWAVARRRGRSQHQQPRR